MLLVVQTTFPTITLIWCRFSTTAVCSSTTACNAQSAILYHTLIATLPLSYPTYNPVSRNYYGHITKNQQEPFNLQDYQPSKITPLRMECFTHTTHTHGRLWIPSHLSPFTNINKQIQTKKNK